MTGLQKKDNLGGMGNGAPIRRLSDFTMSTTDPDAALMWAKVGGPCRINADYLDRVCASRDRCMRLVIRCHRSRHLVPALMPAL